MTQEHERKLAGIFLKFSDGTIQYLVDPKDVERWNKANIGIASYLENYPGSPKWPQDLNWKETDIPDATEVFLGFPQSDNPNPNR